MDSFEINKIMGAVLATLVGLMLVHIGANMYFAHRAPEKPGYEIAVVTPEEKPGATAAPKEEPLAQRLAAADLDRGKAAFKRCMSCHTVDKGGANRVGPNLYGVVGRDFANAQGFNYSGAMQKHGGHWTAEEMDNFLRSPKQTIPGTSMIFAGIARGGERADLLVYLNQQSDKPIELPKEDAAPKEAPAKDAGEQKGEAAKPETAKPEAEKAPVKDEAPAKGEAPAKTEAPAEQAPAKDASPAKPEAAPEQPAPAEKTEGGTPAESKDETAK